MNIEGVPPHDLRTERALLGSMLLLDAAILDAIERVDPIDFYNPRHQTVFTAIAEVYGRGVGVDAISVADAIERSGQSKTDDYEYLLELQTDTPIATNAEHYAQIVADHSQLRQLAVAGMTVRNIAYSSPADVPGALDEAEATITAAIDERTLGDVAHVGTEIDDVIEGIYKRSLGLEENGVASGLTDLDQILGGFRPRQLIVIGARPAMGKTALSIELALSVARQNKPVLFTSLEMGRSELQERFIATMSMVGARKKPMDEADQTRMKKAANELRSLPIEIDENPAASVLSIKGNARRVARRNNGEIGMVIVDYLQLMTGRLSAENRQVENKTPTSSCSSTETRSTNLTPLAESPKLSSPSIATAPPARPGSHGWPTSQNSPTSPKAKARRSRSSKRLWLRPSQSRRCRRCYRSAPSAARATTRMTITATTRVT